MTFRETLGENWDDQVAGPGFIQKLSLWENTHYQSVVFPFPPSLLEAVDTARKMNNRLYKSDLLQSTSEHDLKPPVPFRQ